MPAPTTLLRSAVTSGLVVVLAACAASPAPDPTPAHPTPATTSAPPASPAPAASTSSSPSPADPSPVPSAEQTPTPIRVDLATTAGGPTHIDIIDWTGTLSGATSGTPGEGASVAPGTIELTNDLDTSLRLTWAAAPCATGDTLVLEPGLARITLLSPPCEGDAIALDRVLVLDLTSPVAADTIEAVVQSAVDTPG